MQLINGAIRLSAGDLAGHLLCRHLTNLDLAVTNGSLPRPSVWDPMLEVLRERGRRHERGFVDHLAAAGYQVVSIEGVGIGEEAVEQTLAAMRSGTEIIVQGAFEAGCWSGRTDILRRVERPSALGPWSYEAIDTKLARETKGATLLQLCLYSDLLAHAQGAAPEWTYVVAPLTGYEPQAFRTADFGAYYRRVKAGLERALRDDAAGTYPEPIEQCDICRWRRKCDQKRRDDDHLCLTAGISKVQINELRGRGIATMQALAAMPLPLNWKPERGVAQSYERAREQARLQVQARGAEQVLYEVLPVEAGYGLCRLPEPSAGDIFFDLEGDPHAGEHGLEYLFGYRFRGEDGADSYVAEWALSPHEEKAAFERFVDFVIARLERYPDLHIYHFAPYELAAIKRLMGRYASREDEVDRMLRGKLFVDLYAIVRQAIRASVESYSIKKLEPLFGFERACPLADANIALTKVQSCIELGDPESIDAEDRAVIERYNCDDCRSAHALRAWLEAVRAHCVDGGDAIERPTKEDGSPSETLSERQQRVAELANAIAGDVPADARERSVEQHARWLLAHLLDWHRREEKSAYWEKFRLADLSAEELMEEPAGLAGLSFAGEAGGTARAPIHRYTFPPQDLDIRGAENSFQVGGAKLGKLADISFQDCWVDIKKRQDTAALHPEALFTHKMVGTDELKDALLRLGEYVAETGISGEGRYRAGRALLLRETPPLNGQELRLPGESVLEAAVRIAPLLDGGVLPVQGPPGAGKTFTGARMICALVRAGRTVGITANSHKVIRNLLDEVGSAAQELSIEVACAQKVPAPEELHRHLRFETDNEAALRGIGPDCPVLGGTAWLWSRADAAESVDVLFVDEAAQMSLANVLAVSQAARSVVLLGDPRQLEQPIQGTHPEGTEASALDHVMGESSIIASDRGLFLEETWRLHPEICSFTSELFYDGQLRARSGLGAQAVRSSGRLRGAGLRYLPVLHRGNRNSSPEEADLVAALVAEALAGAPSWIDRTGTERPLSLDDILIVAPFNAQVFELQTRLPEARIGTVDKFQGQEASIVICSMATSSAAEAPRGMEFLYSANRLNVATSRARCLCVLVASPDLFEATCRTPHQMQLANAFCRYLELAREVSGEALARAVA